MVNLPDLEIVEKYRPNIGIMSMIDAEANLNQHFLICQNLSEDVLSVRGN